MMNMETTHQMNDESNKMMTRQQQTTPKRFDIDYIFFSEFDIDKGAVVRVQYPKIFPLLQETELSAQMLPDGSHNCQEDSTVFIVRPPKKNNDEQQQQMHPFDEELVASIKHNTDPIHNNNNNNNNNSVNKSNNHYYYYYGLNMYKQKKYENIRRGARVKAIAVVGKSKLCLTLKPLLSQALEIIFQISDHAKNQCEKSEENQELTDQMVYDKTTAQLQDFFHYLYHYINSIDLSSVPDYDDTQKLVWRFCLRNHVPLYHVIETSLASYESVVLEERRPIVQLRIPTHLLENEISILFEKRSTTTTSTSTTTATSTSTMIKKRKQNIKRRMSISKDPVSPSTADLKKRKEKYDGTKASLVNLILVFGEKTMMIFNAILYGKSILFCGANKNAGFVIQFVLASLLLLPTLPNVFSERVFPYVSFMNMDWLKERENGGFIAGVTNPIFATRDEYFDYLCDIDTGKIQMSQFEKLRLQQKQMLSSSSSSGSSSHHHYHISNNNKKPKIKSVKRHRHRRHASISELATMDDDDYNQPDTPRNRKRASTPTSDTSSPETPTPTSATIPSNNSSSSEGFGLGMGMIADTITGALSSDATSGIVQSLTVKVAENDDVCHMTSKDTEFIRRVMDLIAENQRRKVSRVETEELVRAQFLDYSTSVMELAFDMKQRILFQKKQYYRSVSSSYERKLSEDDEPDDNVLKTFTWRQTNSFKLYSDKRAEQAKRRLIDPALLDIPLGITTLTHRTELDEEEIISFFQKLLRLVKTREELLEFISYLPESKGGINSIVYPIFHSSPAVRIVVVAMLRRLEKENLLINLNEFLMITYQRNVLALPNTY